MARIFQKAIWLIYNTFQRFWKFSIYKICQKGVTIKIGLISFLGILLHVRVARDPIRRTFARQLSIIRYDLSVVELITIGRKFGRIIRVNKWVIHPRRVYAFFGCVYKIDNSSSYQCWKIYTNRNWSQVALVSNFKQRTHILNYR